MRLSARMVGGEVVQGEVLELTLTADSGRVAALEELRSLMEASADTGAATEPDADTQSEGEDWESSGLDPDDLADLAAIAAELASPVVPRADRAVRRSSPGPSRATIRRAAIRSRIAETLGSPGDGTPGIEVRAGSDDAPEGHSQNVAV